jgi:hypothetical protein
VAGASHAAAQTNENALPKESIISFPQILPPLHGDEDGVGGGARNVHEGGKGLPGANAGFRVFRADEIVPQTDGKVLVGRHGRVETVETLRRCKEEGGSRRVEEEGGYMRVVVCERYITSGGRLGEIGGEGGEGETGKDTWIRHETNACAMNLPSTPPRVIHQPHASDTHHPRHARHT